jgi:hypothetical protein
MRTISIASCALPGLLLGVCFAAAAAGPQHDSDAARSARTAIDAKSGRLLRPLTAPERGALADAVASRQRTLRQPRTEAEARPTLALTPNGKGMTMQVPSELWNTLSMQKDAQGRLHVLEADGTEIKPVVAREDVK